MTRANIDCNAKSSTCGNSTSKHNEVSKQSEMLTKFYTSSIFLTWIFLNFSDAKILRGKLLTRDNWAFLTRFCFLTEHGIFRYDFEIQVKNSTGDMNLLLYYDSADQWPSIYPSNKTCQEKESILSWERGQIVPLTTFTSDCVEKENSIIQCTSYRKFRSSRPRWWFIALSDCSSKDGINVTYFIKLTNASPGHFWREHFSADEFYILPELIATLCIYTLLLIVSCYIAKQLRSRRLLHVTYKIFITSVFCQLLGISLETYSYINLAMKGINVASASLLGNIFEACSEMFYTMLMLLLALGYTITKSVLTSIQRQWLFTFICLSGILESTLYVYQSHVFDPGLVLYIYESPPGYGLITLKLSAWILFVYHCFKTSHNMTTKTHFYASLLSLGSTWFLFHPLTVLGMTLLVDKWIRESIVKGCSLWMIFVGHALFLYVTRPSMANYRFPFHIRTSQVVPIAGNGQDHGYEPRAQTTIPMFMITR